MRRYKGANEKLIHGSVDFSPILEEQADCMDKDEILRTLVSCGLSEYESKVYSSLIFLGTSKAGTISRASKVPQSKIYEVLDQLMNKQLVEVFDGRPKEFRAPDPENALKNLLEGRIMEIETIKTKIDSIGDYLKSSTRDEVNGGVWIIKGEKFREFFNKTSEMLKRSETYVYAITRNFSRSVSMSESLKKCLKRGVNVRMVAMEKLTKNNYYRALWYKDRGIEIRWFNAKVHPRIIVVDGKEILLRLDHDPHKRNKFRFNSLWSEDLSLVTVMDNYVKHIWENAMPIDFNKIKVPS